MSEDKETFFQSTSFLVSNTIQSYQFQYIVPPIMLNFLGAYRNSYVVKELIHKYTSKNKKYDYQILLDHARGKTLLEPNALPSEIKLISAFVFSINDKRNVIHYVWNRIRATLHRINDRAKEKGSKHLDLGNLHWDLLVDIECLLYSCRSLLDVFARLTKNLRKQINPNITLPDSFTAQVDKASKYKQIDPLYFEYISRLRWFKKLIEYRDELTHKTSLKLQIIPVRNRNFAIKLCTIKDKLISWPDLNDIIKGTEDFCKFYVQHYQKVLSQTPGEGKEKGSRTTKSL